MAFDITRFGSDSSNVKSILDGVRYYRYFNKDNNTLTTPGYFPADLGLNVGDRIAVVPSTKTNADEMYIVTSVANRVVTVTQVDTDGLVDSVNGKTGAVVLDAEDVGALPSSTTIPDAVQYSTMPTASADNEGQIVQFTGATDTYTNGYFYKCTAIPTDPSATISQTVGSGLTDLAVDLDTFIAQEQPSGDESVSFVASVVSGSITATTTFPFTITCVDPEGFISALQTITSQPRDWIIEQMNGGNKFSYNDSNQSGEIEGWAAGYWLPDGTFEQYFTFDPTLSGYCEFGCNYTEGSTAWKKDNQTVNISAYGITFTGTPANNDTLTVVYNAGTVSGYDWTRTDVQPSVEKVLTQVSGYDATKNQTLKNTAGVISWVDD